MVDLQPVTLHDPTSSLSATYVPSAGMICTSLADDGVEFLGQRRGIEAYVTAGKTMGIPLLYPWANRLSVNTYQVDGDVVVLTAGTDGVRDDEHGSPIHGILAGNPDWQVTEQTENRLVATLDWGDSPDRLAVFPVPHVLTMTVTLADRTLTVETTVTPSADVAVPLCYGYHPYLQLPDVPRPEWQLETPAMHRLPVDDRGIPTGDTEEWPGGTEQLAGRTLDDGFDQVPAGAVFAISGGDRRVEVTYVTGYPSAQLFAPPTDDVIGIEPMTAPTDSLTRGTYSTAAPGQPETSTFTIRVT